MKQASQTAAKQPPQPDLQQKELQKEPRPLMPGTVLAATATGFLCAFLAIACIAQALQNLRASSANSAADAAATSAAAAVGTALSSVRTKLDQLGAPIGETQLATSESRRATGRNLSAAMGEGAVIELYSPQVPELEIADFARFGFTRAAVLAEARDLDGEAPAQVRRGPNDWRIVQARPLMRDSRLAGILYADLPLSSAADPVKQIAESSAVHLELRQQRAGGGDFVLVGLGPKPTASAPGAEAAVPATQLTIGAMHPKSFQVSDALSPLAERSVLALLIATALLAMASVGAFWMRRRALGRVVAGADDSRLEVMPANVHSVPVQPSAQATALRAKMASVDSADAAPAPPPKFQLAQVDRSIFRAYDIRGVMGKTLSVEVARTIGAAIGSETRHRGLREVVVGRDGRLSGPVLVEALIDGLRGTGCDVIDIGLVPTPVLYFATYHLNAGSGVMLTGSHNPPDHNGFKIVLGGETLSGEAIQSLYARIAESRIATGMGGLQEIDVRRDYIDRIAGDIQLERKLRVVVDAGNGAAGEIGPAVLEAIGCDVVSLNCEIDGNFPNHHPDPSDPANLQDLIVSVKQFNADVGLAYDGDGDRLGVVTREGAIINPDRLLMLFARDVLSRVPGATVIYDVKCTGKLHEVILGHGGSPIMWKTGHSLIKGKMREEDAELAGEMSGHFFFRERWYGFDDGIYASARLAEILASSSSAVSEVFRELPDAVSTPELKVPMAEGRTHTFVEEFARRAQFEGARLTTLDGIRADFADGWGLVRSSNTTSVLVMRFEAENPPALLRIQELFRSQLLAVEPKLVLPF